MRRGCLRWWIGLVCCAALLAGPGFLAAAETPEFAVTEIQTALDQGDLPRFERRADVDALCGQGAAIFIDMLRKAGEKESASLPPVLALLGSAAQKPETAVTLRAMLAGEAAAFVRDGVESGRFGGKTDGKTAGNGRGMLAPLFADVSTGRKSLRVTGKAVPAKGAKGGAAQAVELPVAVKDKGNGREYPVRLRLEKTEGLWKVTRIADLPEIAGTLWKEATNPE